ncbi:unnamed protein product, partial [Ectocarpus fasciculatus]
RYPRGYLYGKRDIFKKQKTPRGQLAPGRSTENIHTRHPLTRTTHLSSYTMSGLHKTASSWGSLHPASDSTEHTNRFPCTSPPGTVFYAQNFPGDTFLMRRKRCPRGYLYGREKTFEITKAENVPGIGQRFCAFFG